MINDKNLYIVTWIDSQSPVTNRWEDIEDMLEPKNMICISVGWIEKETKDNIVIMPHISDIYDKEEKGHACGLMTIPKVAILKRVNIKYKL